MGLSDVGRQSDDYRTIDWTSSWIRVNTLCAPENPGNATNYGSIENTPSSHAPRSATTFPVPCLPQ